MTKDLSFRAAVVAPPGEEVRQFGYWCPWCETTHLHGLGDRTPSEAVGRVEHRVSHCLPQASPLAGRGVALRIDRLTRSWDHLEPPGPYPAIAGDPLKMRAKLSTFLGESRLGLALSRLVFGRHRSAQCFDAKLVGGWAQIWCAGATWFVQNERRETLSSGSGLGPLLARLFGTTTGIVFVRVGLDGTGVELSPEYQIAIAGLVDRGIEGVPFGRAVAEVLS